MWANAMREVLTMVGDSTDEASGLIRAEAEAKLQVFLGWLDGSLPKPTDEERQRLVRECTVLYRKARAAAGIEPPTSQRVSMPEPTEAAAQRRSAPG